MPTMVLLTMGLEVKKKVLITTLYFKYYYKMWVQFIIPHSLDQWIHYFSTDASPNFA
jgi:hypothetical protein